MVTFFSILMTLIAVNAILLVFSVNRNKSKQKKATSSFSKLSTTSRVYPMNYSEAKYKKAV
ncbi:hypothetical protein KO500_10600 [Cellulophaga baltica]|uniref:hypothetical protein n=1 Tax=Cellulophaga TaxID=104264 RepID=UPI001C07D9BD|nr:MULTISPECIES: hypothetical protein [Cellulophaga]MBU2996888.1 hypothetical protein [Cellulophaga baltica]MDO6768286.1 hypothetical protein [Cellulophaga sp. 1_MG-2023]